MPFRRAYSIPQFQYNTMHVNTHGTERRRAWPRKVSVILVDDMTGGEADETVEFGLDGTGYEIDLNYKNAQELRDLLKPYTEKGRKVTSAAPRLPRVRTASDEERNKRMRAWAKEQGFKISERGRVPARKSRPSTKRRTPDKTRFTFQRVAGNSVRGGCPCTAS
jgi:hypothetical protein